jgi:hypothetical protein
MQQADRDHAIASVVATLRGEFPQEAEAVISSRVEQAFAVFDRAPIRDFVPILAARKIRGSLRRQSVESPLPV